MKRQDGFPEDFTWGVATASYQIEGSRLADGASETVWDAFARKPGAVLGGMDGSLACDSYRRWKDDVGLVRGLGVDAYRFSLSWARIQPEGKGAANRKAIDHYRRFIEALLEAGVEPWITLYHWDHPNCLEEEGGWPWRDMAYRFAEYADICFREFGDLARKWMTVNEPWCSSILSFDKGEHAPGLRDKVKAYRAVHHLLLGHGLAVEAFRAASISAKGPAGSLAQAPSIGIALNPSLPRPATRRPEDVWAASRAGDERTALFMDPLFGMGYPERHLAAYPNIAMPIVEGDLDKIAQPVDFIGVNYYDEDVVEAAPVSPEFPEGFRRIRSWQHKTDMGWSIVPGGLLRILRHLDDAWHPASLVVTENGAACRDEPDSGGRVRDAERIDYLRGHIGACEDAIREGIPLEGYFEWSLLDNFEWSWGYSKRFGLVHVDFRSQERIPKDSYYWYRDLVAGHGFRQ